MVVVFHNITRGGNPDLVGDFLQVLCFSMSLIVYTLKQAVAKEFVARYGSNNVTSTVGAATDAIKIEEKDEVPISVDEVVVEGEHADEQKSSSMCCNQTTETLFAPNKDKRIFEASMVVPAKITGEGGKLGGLLGASDEATSKFSQSSGSKNLNTDSRVLLFFTV